MTRVFKILYKKKDWLFRKNIKKNIFLNAVRNVKIQSSVKINSYEILFLSANQLK